ncbi:hypothetical protein P3L10_027019 [Capsicum annuum]
MSEKNKFDSTPSRKSPRIIQEHSPINFSRPSFDLGCFTPSPKSKSKKKVVEVDSIPHNKIKILPEKSDLSKKVVVPDFKKVDKRKKNVGQHDSNSDFEDEIFVPKMKKSKKESRENARVTRSKVSVGIDKVDDNKSDKKKSRNMCKKQYTHWSSYIKVNVFDDLKQRWTTEHFKIFQKSPFCQFLNMHFLKIQPQLLRSLLLAEINNDRDDLFIFNINGKELHFEKREFSVVSGLKCFKKSDFVSDPKVKNKLMNRYYSGMDKVMRSVFYDDLVNRKISYRVEDLYEIGLVYFISRFLQSELPRTFIKKADFDLVESGHYLKYDWGELIFYDYLQSTMFKRYNNEYVVRDIVFTNEEEMEFNLGAIHQDSLGHEHSNVRRDMSLFQKKVESEFNGMREFVQESVKFILNELRLVKQQSSEFVEKENVDVGLQTPSATNKQDEVLVDPVIEKYSFGDDVSL